MPSVHHCMPYNISYHHHMRSRFFSFFTIGLIPDIIDAFPDVEIAGSKVALMYLKGLTNRDFTQHPVKGGDKIDLGKGACKHPCFTAVLPCWLC